ncbi:LacI family DNA-binding transcriptional regulator [uncultured Amnibacterium sp.]|uniref:LacI family DNA-binding transcriptional regulator n=1 Tax=uncultured Amnibacterium sp. TaxID=1631851 RepID=UPI0035CAE148
MAGPPRLTDGRPGSGRATILDVAAAAGVSRQTVTRAMNGMPGISPATKQRVLAAAEALAYRPSRFGRGLVTGGERQLGLVVDDLRNPWSPELAAAVVRIAATEGWNVLLADVALSGDAERMVASLGAQTDAVIGYLGVRAAAWIELLGAAPVVELDPVGEPLRGAVHLDRSAAVAAAVDHLVAAGVRAPLALDSARPDGPSRRVGLMAAAFARHGIPLRTASADSHSAEAAAGAVEPVLADDRPDAILAFNDLMALGALSACRRARVDVPGELRVVGIDGLALGGLVTPALTTLDVDLDAVAREALDLAVAMLAGAAPRSGPDAQRTVRHRLLLRDSA